MQLEKITPEQAKAMLETSKAVSKKTEFKQRKINKNNIGKLVKVMQKGYWRGYLSEPVALTAQGEIVNGQHRLTAVVDSGTTQEFYVIRNANKEDFKFIDQVQKPRTLSDVLMINGYSNYANKAAACRIIDTYEMKSPQIGGASLLMTQEAIDRIDDYGDNYIDEYVKRASKLYKGADMRMSTTLAAMMISMESEKDNYEVLDEWTNGILGKAPTYANDPRNRLKDYSRPTGAGKHTGTGKTSNQTTFQEDFNAYRFCWNQWIAGAEFKQTLGHKQYGRNSKFIPLVPVTAYVDR